MHELSSTATSLIEYCTANRRVCPESDEWHRLWKMLPDHQQRAGGGWNPPFPLILAALSCENWEKRLRLRDHIQWADDHDVIEQVDEYLRGLSEEQWVQSRVEVCSTKDSVNIPKDLASPESLPKLHRVEATCVKLLSLDSSRWSELKDACGSASDIPVLLRQLANVADASVEEEPWLSLWGYLACHGVYSATFAAVPHIIQIIESAPLEVDFRYFQFVAHVEVHRKKINITVPEDLAPAYFESLSKLPALVAAAANREWDATFLSCALAAIAVSKGQVDIAEIVQELPWAAEAFMRWFNDPAK